MLYACIVVSLFLVEFLFNLDLENGIFKASERCRANQQKLNKKASDLEVDKAYKVVNIRPFNCSKLKGQRVIQIELEEFFV